MLGMQSRAEHRDQRIAPVPLGNDKACVGQYPCQCRDVEQVVGPLVGGPASGG